MDGAEEPRFIPMTDQPVRCPNCGQPVDAGGGTTEEKVQCPKCRFLFSAQASVWAPAQGAAAPPPVPSVLNPTRTKQDESTVACPRCGTGNTRGALFCGSCGVNLREARAAGFPPGPPGKGGERKRMWLLGGAIFLVAALAGAGTWWFLVFRKTPAPAPAPGVRAAAEKRPAATLPEKRPADKPPSAVKTREEFYANGKLMGRGTVKLTTDGRETKHGVWSNYWASGALSMFGAYENGEKVGDWPFFSEDGRISLTNQYRPPSRAALRRVPPAVAPKKAPPPPSSPVSRAGAVTPGHPISSSPVPATGAMANRLSLEAKIKLGQRMMDQARMRIAAEPAVQGGPQTPPGFIGMGQQPSKTVPFGRAPSGTKAMGTTAENEEAFRTPKSNVIRSWSGTSNTLAEAQQQLLEGSNLVERARKEMEASQTPPSGGAKP